jgi:hypothetical protein
MESFLSNLGPHVTSLVNQMVIRRVDTGDRMLDNTVQMLFSTLVAALVSGIITLYTKGLWREVANRCAVLCGRGTYDPLRFNPLHAPEKPLNGTLFLYRADVPSTRYTIALSWFYVNHADKKYNQKLCCNLKYPCMKDRNDLMDSYALAINGVGRTSLPTGTWLPVWRSQKGDFVYMASSDRFEDEGVQFLSDSCEALRECMAHVEAHEDLMTEHAKELAKKRKAEGSQYLYEVTMKGEFEPALPLNKRKTFDTLFFTQKGDVVKMLEAFKRGELFAKHMPVDHKLGFILHGPPGTGKTGFITACANFLERDVVNVDVSRIRTRKELDAILRRGADRHIFVFEEFDCMPGVARRTPVLEEGEIYEGSTASAGSQPQGPLPAAPYAMMLLAEKEKSQGLMEDYRAEMEAARDKLDLGYLLRKLDGLESGDGRIIIATTNHPERIDPALLRPGRFGIQVNLTRCTRAMLRDIVAMVYQLDEPKKAEVERCLADVPDFKWSPAEVLQLGVTLPGVTEIVARLRSARPQRME